MKGSLRAKIGAFWACFGCSSGMFSLVEKLGSLLVCAASRGVTLREAPKKPSGRFGGQFDQARGLLRGGRVRARPAEVCWGFSLRWHLRGLLCWKAPSPARGSTRLAGHGAYFRQVARSWLVPALACHRHDRVLGQGREVWVGQPAGSGLSRNRHVQVPVTVIAPGRWCVDDLRPFGELGPPLEGGVWGR